MYGSYGSYSSMSASAPIDISSSRSRNDYSYTSCAFPSWPRRPSLSGSDDDQYRATSYLSDDELFPQDPLVDDDARSIGSASSVASPVSPRVTEEELLEMERERARAQREYVKFLVSEKERRRVDRRRQQQMLQRRSSSGSGHSAASSSSKKSPKGSKLSTMTPIVEAGE